MLALFKLALLVSLTIETAIAIDAECTKPADMVGISYEIIKKNKPTGDIISRETMNFWRMRDQVVYEYEARQYAEIWNLVSNGQIRPVRYFDEFKQGIEYQPMDVNDGKGDKNWSAKNNIVSEQLRQQLTQDSVSGEGCEQIISYSQKQALSLKTVRWLSYYQLPESMQFFNNGVVIEWQALQIISDPEIIQQAFNQRSHYKTTDYADIGDNESNPVISKMIHQGFTELHGGHGDH